ncbi:hypothetical protein [Helicobacter sp. T3_23-1059]
MYGLTKWKPNQNFVSKLPYKQMMSGYIVFYYFNDEIPTQADFEKTMADYLTFEFNMITHGMGYLVGFKSEQDNE